MVVTFFVPCDPPKTTKQMTRTAVVNGRVGRFETKEGKQAAETLTALIAPHAPVRPLRGPLKLVYTVTWPWRKADQATKAKKALCDEMRTRPYTGKPDLDNFEKRLLDTLKAVRVIEDDSLIYSKVGSKFVGTNPGISIYLEEMPDAWEG